MSKIKQMLLATAAMCAAAQSYNSYSINRKKEMAFKGKLARNPTSL